MKLFKYLIVGFAILKPTAFFANEREQDGSTIVRQGNGKGLTPCAPCHGEKGEGKLNEGFPQLAGLPAAYLKTQIANFRSGVRMNPVMQPIAQMMDEVDTDLTAAFLANQEAKPLEGFKASTDELGAKIATVGLWNKGIPACFSCHGPNGLGVGSTFPRIVWQPQTYIVAQITAWKNNTRKGDPNGLMKVIADKLTDAEIKSVANYLGSVKGKP
ncbi:MAG TPA: c-type cytochrome [Oligoflexus sp.]|uniref:c-type cytochrome n=1 Tax=Oligoflexus sp. TaxID=1971216 RepID=UPI002D7FEBE8|nr:c-type cytochrome [Oligoflexus sp.]HET9239067.1 c-type cytochrome [Oligoflexus sp.]